MHYRFQLPAAVAAFCLLITGPAWTDDHPHDMGDMHEHQMGNLEVFLSVQGVTHSGGDLGSDRREDSWGIADIVFAANRGRWRTMGEFNLGQNEHDLERFSVGWEPVPDTLLWFGRFHQPGSAWNNEFHHGHYLQTTVTRPSIELWEDEEGLVPQHLSGALLESRRPLGAVAGLQFSVGLGYGSNLTTEGLNPVDLLNINHGSHRLSETARISFLPQYLGSSSMGLLFGHHRTPVLDTASGVTLNAQIIDQQVSGGYFDFDRETWRAVTAIYYVAIDLEGATTERREHFASGYLQVERQFPHHLTGFARHENSSDAMSSLYVSIHADDFVAHGNLVGLRWDFAHRQALTIELSRLSTIHASQSVARIQWSGVVP